MQSQAVAGHARCFHSQPKALHFLHVAPERGNTLATHESCLQGSGDSYVLSHNAKCAGARLRACNLVKAVPRDMRACTRVGRCMQNAQQRLHQCLMCVDLS